MHHRVKRAVFALAGPIVISLGMSFIAPTAQAAPNPTPPSRQIDPRAVKVETAPTVEDEVWTLEVIDGQLMIGRHDSADPAAVRRVFAASGKRVFPKGVRPVKAVAEGTGSSNQDTPTPGDPLGRCFVYGTSGAWCNHKWEYNDYNDPQVYFLDHTPSGFPVSANVWKWYQSPGIDAYYRWYTQGCPSSRVHCVHVYTAPLGGSYGVTYWNAYAPQGPATVYIEQSLSGSAQADKTTCHELGHALGLDHNTSTNSCMKQGAVSTGISRSPSSQDFTVLTLIYPKPGT